MSSADDRNQIQPEAEAGEPASATPSHLPGEAGIPNIDSRIRQPISKLGLLALALLLASIVSVAAFGVIRLTGFGKKVDDDENKLASNRPSAATAEPRRLELLSPRPVAPESAPRVPAIVPTAEELAEPIPVRRNGPAPAKVVAPEDAPVMLVTSRPRGASPINSETGNTSAEPHATAERSGAGPLDQTRQNLEAYQRQLQGLMSNMTRAATAAAATAGATGGLASTTMSASSGQAQSAAAAPASPGSLFGGTLQGSSTPRVAAGTLGQRSLTLPKGSAFTCALKTRIVSATSGLIGCQVQRNVYGDDGRVLLVERGSHLDGEYRSASIRPGTVRIPVLWTRIRTPLGVTVDVESPGTGQLGESGVDGTLDNRWPERIGAAMLLSLIDDSVKLIIQEQAGSNDGDNNTTIVMPSTTSNTSKLAEKVLESTINIPPLIYRNQGGIVGIVVARDVDFSSVYELRPVDVPARVGAVQ